MPRRRIGLAALTGLCCLLVVSTAPAQNDDETPNRTRAVQKEADRDRDRTERRRERADGETRTDRSGQDEQLFEQLQLSEQQRQQIRQSIQEHNREIAQVWRRFHQVHMAAVNLEATWFAALEDTMSDEQKERFREARESETRERTGTDRDRNRGGADRDADRSERSRDRDKRQRNRGDADDAPAARDSRRDAATNRNERRQGADAATSGRKGERGASQQDGEQVRGVLIIGITAVSPDRYTERADLSPQQKAQSEKLGAQYKRHLQTLWRQLHGLHLQMVKLEADKLQAIEKHLTEEQLAQLHKTRGQPDSRFD
ncbi:MAG: hypothetical protein KY476_18925 [Planctomycetes bacterium]|nr:hypothetical protein [Planctomycetota bacterium]